MEKNLTEPITSTSQESLSQKSTASTQSSGKFTAYSYPSTQYVVNQASFKNYPNELKAAQIFCDYLNKMQFADD